MHRPQPGSLLNQPPYESRRGADTSYHGISRNQGTDGHEPVGSPMSAVSFCEVYNDEDGGHLDKEHYLMKGKRLLNAHSLNEIMQAIALETEDLKHQSWMRSIFGIGDRVGSIPASDVIHPFSPFARIMTTVSGLFLIYTALVTPFVLGFFWDANPCTKLEILEFDMLVDSFFIFEIIYSFCLGTYDKGVYIHRFTTVAWRYLTGMFCFDLITSIPVSYVEFIAIKQCEGAGANFDPSATRLLRLIKPFRMFRILRLVRNQKLLVVLDYVEYQLKLPPFTFKMLRLLALIFGVVHMCSCFFYLVKVVSNQPAEVEAFLHQHGLSGESDRFEKYVVSFYFINTIFTTVGFGDIGATNTEERCYVVVVMYIGTIVFGLLLAEVDTAVAYMRRIARKRGLELQVLLDFLRSKHTPPKLEKDIMEWAGFEWNIVEDLKMTEGALRMVPKTQLYNLKKHLHSDRLLSVPIFASLRSIHREQLLVDVWLTLRPKTFNPSKVILGPKEECTHMHIIRAGTVRVLTFDPKTHQPRVVAVLRPGDSFGSYSLMGETDAARAFDIESASFTAGHSFVECFVLSRSEFLNLINTEYAPDVKAEIKRDLDMHMITRDQFLRNTIDENGHHRMTSRVMSMWTTMIARILKLHATSEWTAITEQTIERSGTDYHFNVELGHVSSKVREMSTSFKRVTSASEQMMTSMSAMVQHIRKLDASQKNLDCRLGDIASQIEAIAAVCAGGDATSVSTQQVHATLGGGGGGGSVDEVWKVAERIEALTRAVESSVRRRDEDVQESKSMAAIAQLTEKVDALTSTLQAVQGAQQH